MWKRENEPAPTPQAAGAPTPSPATPATPRSEPEAPAPRPTAVATARAVFGPSLELTGELSGAEDLLVEGRVQGKIRLPQHSVIVGAKGRVSAEVQARVLEIEGEVDGHLSGEELIVLRKSARVRGDLVAPRVVIEDGAKFKGSIDMEPKRATGSAPAAGPRPLPADEPSHTAAASGAKANPGSSTRAS